MKRRISAEYFLGQEPRPPLVSILAALLIFGVLPATLAFIAVAAVMAGTP